eukprot:6961455-Ditylum_brightwellii.AAC.1
MFKRGEQGGCKMKLGNVSEVRTCYMAGGRASCHMYGVPSARVKALLRPIPEASCVPMTAERGKELAPVVQLIVHCQVEFLLKKGDEDNTAWNGGNNAAQGAEQFVPLWKGNVLQALWEGVEDSHDFSLSGQELLHGVNDPAKHCLDGGPAEDKVDAPEEVSILGPESLGSGQ